MRLDPAPVATPSALAPRAVAAPCGGGPDTADCPSIRWLGHATAEINLDGVRLLTDPMLLDAIVPFVRRRAPEAAPVDRTRPIDAVLISHAHQDHLHLPSLRLLPAGTRIIVPAGLGRWLAQRGFDHVEELAAGEQAWVGPVRVTATPAAHHGRRLPLGPDAPALGYLVEGTAAIYFAGDTELFDGMAAIPRSLDTALAAALLPVGGWGPTLRGGHMDPLRAAEAARRLDPVHAVPIHWGTFWPRGLGRVRSDRFHRPGPAFEAAAAHAASNVRVHVLRPGEVASVGAA
ncbi:MAG: MBL fold metallo-hydrolase [Dehalococcoidia bacterium]